MNEFSNMVVAEPIGLVDIKNMIWDY